MAEIPQNHGDKKREKEKRMEGIIRRRLEEGGYPKGYSYSQALGEAATMDVKEAERKRAIEKEMLGLPEDATEAEVTAAREQQNRETEADKYINKG